MQAPTVSVAIGSWDIRTGVTGEMTLQAAREAEAVGLDGVVAGDHVTFYGFGNDGLITLTAIAAVTSRVELKTGVYLLPLRHPVPVALQCAQLDQLSGGRLIFGIGVGGEDPHEFWSSGVDPSHRGRRADEAVQIIKRLWVEDAVTFHGREFTLDDVTVYPKPLRPIPVFVGGRSDAAVRRAGRFGDGYTGIWQSLDRLRQVQQLIAETSAKVGREPAEVEVGMQFWVAAAESRTVARSLVASSMEAVYRLPFERFERYTPFGTPAEIAEFVLPYVEAGARHINFVAAQGSPQANVESAAAIREAIRAGCR